ncbi:MAG: hypothetical protein ACPG8F_03310 [Flavobacteriaceae bacterium]
MSKSIYLGNIAANTAADKIKFQQIKQKGETFYKIENINAMPPFFMSVVSNSNHWMFISSNGALSAGRKNSDQALFPYYTDDKITESTEHTGSKTILLVTKGEKTYLWEPFTDAHLAIYSIQRNLYKNAFGNKIIFEETNQDLGLTFSYEWNSSNTFGFVRKASLKNNSNEKVSIDLLDGLQNILPYGVGEDLQKQSSNLVDAYKKTELHPTSGIGIYSLSAIIVDRAEPSEALKANLVWSTGLNGAKKLLSSTQLKAFKEGKTIEQETDIRAKRGAYFLVSNFELGAGEEEKWRIIAEVNKSITALVALEEKINTPTIDQNIDQDIADGTQELLQLVGAADGLQCTNDKRGNDRHFANTMFNIMRGGIFDDNYTIEKSDFLPYLQKANKRVYKKHESTLNALEDSFTIQALIALASKEENADFSRLCFEYLPLKFSRRHGDPSRPWNKFSINTKDEIDGSKILDYQGNWRDIFQNWEALAHSYPAFIQGMIHKFLNATTFDGYNPYRVTKDGFDWETIEPNNPWAYIGYWGDHQIIYLLKFLEFIEKHFPGKLNDYYTQECFVYANVPYKIKPYSAIVKDPKNTILYDHEGDALIQQKRSELGADGALLNAPDGEVYKVTFIEKMLATVLAKLANFIPEAGIWMNTQRPEWNDANNALVGNGVSMVTLYYLRRFLAFFKKNLQGSNQTTFGISNEMKSFFTALDQAFNAHRHLVKESISNQQRKTLMDALGTASSNYRETIYAHGFSGKKEQLEKENVTQFIDTALLFIEDAIRKNKKENGLYHAYNLISIEDENTVSVDYLADMLEGQVAVLSSGLLNAEESLAVLEALRNSALYREDQKSYILYPNKTLPLFIDRNNLPASAVEHSSLLTQLVADGNHQIISKDIKGAVHFNGNFKNADDLNAALDQLENKYTALVDNERTNILAIFEKVFNHKAFTGRSGTFYGYEGLGSIYWHMVSKLALAAYEVVDQSINSNAQPQLIEGLKQHYYAIVEGIGAHKSPEDYGAFPSDPYSHTPSGKGAQQPGMTGQVKEDILSRFGELGVRIESGALHFDTALLKEEEYLTETTNFDYYTVSGESKSLQLKQNSLAFTYCQVPIIYTQGEENKILINFTNGEEKTFDGKRLDQETSETLFSRNNTIETIEVIHSVER